MSDRYSKRMKLWLKHNPQHNVNYAINEWIDKFINDEFPWRDYSFNKDGDSFTREVFEDLLSIVNEQVNHYEKISITPVSEDNKMTEESKFPPATLKIEGKSFFGDNTKNGIPKEEECCKLNQLYSLENESFSPTDVLSPEQFTDKVSRIVNSIIKNGGDASYTHQATDAMTEELLIALGYGKAIDIIRSYHRWYE